MPKKQNPYTGLGLGHKDWLFDEEESSRKETAHPAADLRVKAPQPRTAEAPGLFASYNKGKPDNKEKLTRKEKSFRPPRLQRKLAGRYALLALALLAVITGSLSGLILVYSAELPQIHDLERYRPSTTTDLYDQKGRLIGSFALERRVIVNYEDLCQLCARPLFLLKTRALNPTGASTFFASPAPSGTTFAARAAGRVRPR